MTEIAHIRDIEGNWTLVRRFTLDENGKAKGRVACADGTVFMPPEVGQESGNDKVVPVIEQTVDNAVTTRTTNTHETIVEADRVIDVVTVADAAVTVDDIKAEAMRRILVICPEWKQRNLTAQAVILADKGRANWTAEEQAAWDAGEIIWGRIAAVRKASNTLEQSLPSDFEDDKHWNT